MRIEFLKPVVVALSMILALSMVLLMVSMVYAIPVEDEDYDEKATGSWTWAYVSGSWDPPTVKNIIHEHGYDIAQDYWGIPDYEYVPQPPEDEGPYGSTRMTLYVYQDTTPIETVESVASVPFQ